MNLWKEGNWQTIHFTNQTIPLNKLDPEDTTTVHCALYLLHVYKAAKNSEIKKKLQQFLRCSAAMKTQKDEITYALENYNFKLFLCTFHQFLFFMFDEFSRSFLQTFKIYICFHCSYAIRPHKQYSESS